MLRTLFFFTALWTVLLISTFLLVPYLLPEKIFSEVKRTKYTCFFTRGWAKLVLKFAGIKVNIKGDGRFPDQADFVIISNHQGNMDIPLIMSLLKYPASFVTKKELMGVPIINAWLKVMNCPVIDRSKPGKAQYMIKHFLTAGIKNPLIIFPEGTRSKSNNMNEFRSGGLKAIRESPVKIIPVSISGTYKAWEQNKRIKKTTVDIYIHPEMEVSRFNALSNDAFTYMLQELIESSIKE